VSLGAAGAVLHSGGLVSKLEQAQKQYILDRFLGQLDRAELLICDELGSVSFSRNGVELLFQLLKGRLRALQCADHEQPGVRRLGADVPGEAS
jgi:DNA replication protein DnaC